METDLDSGLSSLRAFLTELALDHFLCDPAGEAGLNLLPNPRLNFWWELFWHVFAGLSAQRAVPGFQVINGVGDAAHGVKPADR